ncbi:LLM class flavin-dependent oxidoreductase [Paracoccus aminophilus]|uniref:Monooxygenase n=1 Tax=Paracoccus aminophilus JCM 7686 TaxID=1367847 RepID=S5Z059_PARAH|nr:LLM class flavin-dependent oxidoreductase [Paracoccus aminophilus]AGT10861.1 monooxygenase [Paracoccus aminophilus JCM 7686]
MARRPDRLSLGLFLFPAGHHIAAWRHPAANAGAGVDFGWYRDLAREAEAAAFDLIFIADGAGARSDDPEVLSRTAHSYVAQFEPVTLISALAAVTERIGLVFTQSSSFNEPFHVARKIASLDHLSGGRAGWNLVTSASDHEARNFNREAHFLHADRYARAEEFVDVVHKLWDSWDADAFLYDKEDGRFFDPAKRHVTDHAGEFFKVQGPLNVPRPPQGRPVTVQAGASEAGRALAARTADLVFTAQQTLEEAQAFYADMNARAEAFGRAPGSIRILPGLFPVVAPSRDAAQEKLATLQELIHPAIGLDLLTGGWMREALAKADPDGPPPDLPFAGNGSQSRVQLLFDKARREGLSLRELYLKVAGARGHWQVVGTPEDIADAIQERFEGRGADGFNIMPPLMPEGLRDFTTLVVPELRRRGLFRDGYDTTTLRGHLGLAALS